MLLATLNFDGRKLTITEELGLVGDAGLIKLATNISWQSPSAPDPVEKLALELMERTKIIPTIRRHKPFVPHVPGRVY